MAKYLSMTSATVPMAEIEAIEAELSWNDQAVAALALLEQYRGDVAAALSELAQQAGVKQTELMLQVNQGAQDIATRVHRAAVGELPGLANTLAAAVALHQLNPDAVEPRAEAIAMLVGYTVVVAIKASQQQK